MQGSCRSWQCMQTCMLHVCVKCNHSKKLPNPWESYKMIVMHNWCRPQCSGYDVMIVGWCGQHMEMLDFACQYMQLQLLAWLHAALYAWWLIVQRYKYMQRYTEYNFWCTAVWPTRTEIGLSAKFQKYNYWRLSIGYIAD